MNDEMIQEVRAIREAHAAKFVFDLRALFDDLKRSEAERIVLGWPSVEAPVTSIKLASLATEFGC